MQKSVDLCDTIIYNEYYRSKAFYRSIVDSFRLKVDNPRNLDDLGRHSDDSDRHFDDVCETHKHHRSGEIFENNLFREIIKKMD